MDRQQEDVAVYHSVITGDVVSSTKVKDWSLLQRVLSESVRRVADLGVRLATSSDVFRGDSIQIVPERPELWMRCALIMRCHVVQGLNQGRRVVFDLRCGVGIGEITDLEARSGSSRGQAFLFSGQSLDTLEKNRRIQVKTPWPELNPGYDLFCEMLDALSSGWTPRQFKTVGLALGGLTQKVIGERMGISQPSVNRHLRKAGYQAVEALVEHSERMVIERIGQGGEDP